MSKDTSEMQDYSAWKRRRRKAQKSAASSFAIFVLSVVLGLIAWQLISLPYSAYFFPSPLETWESFRELTADGVLYESITASASRIIIGWSLGLIVGVPIGLLMGRFSFIRRLLDPYIEFFRFVPPISFVTLAIIWFGVGEASKVVLIFYTSVFIFTISTIAGVLAVNPLRIRAAEALGAGPVKILLSVIVPASVPAIVTGGRLAMGNSFLTIVSAEIIAAQHGLGALIWKSRNYAQTEWVFVGIITLGIMGFLFDRVIRLITAHGLKRYLYTAN
ncbi:MAG: ABC transporter permease [Burkholderiaceae bacterium]|nr:MAG: ABC transporter permease [Burkholderiaceae bacterium]TAM04175.1 MAG: ABC transporter permease [Pusillimonas sp.]